MSERIVIVDGKPVAEDEWDTEHVLVEFLSPESEEEDPSPSALDWVNHANIWVDEAQDEVTMTISVGDPRGAFGFTIRRVPEDSANEFAGRLVMHVPRPDQALLHMPLKELHPGTFLIGHYGERFDDEDR